MAGETLIFLNFAMIEQSHNYKAAVMAFETVIAQSIDVTAVI